mmetsp:Transcript_14171/g.32908  ORF Transcript_14171/g.32908 Transcript_14171/m.32908 type:complete len:114 (-) Transcript_14171:236-577(-)
MSKREKRNQKRKNTNLSLPKNLPRVKRRRRRQRRTREVISLTIYLVDGSSGDLYIGSCLFSKLSTKTHDIVPFQMEHQQEGNSTSNHSDNATTNTFNDSNVIRIYLVPILHLI